MLFLKFFVTVLPVF